MEPKKIWALQQNFATYQIYVVNDFVAKLCGKVCELLHIINAVWACFSFA